MSYATILRDAAYNVLLPPGEDEDAPGSYGVTRFHRYSCNAIQFTQGAPIPLENYAAKDWYYNTILCADRSHFSAAMSDVDYREQQNVRFMLLLFASYLAEDLGL